MSNSQLITVLGVFVADTAYRAERAPRMGETILGNSFALGPGGKPDVQKFRMEIEGRSMVRLSQQIFQLVKIDLAL